MRTRIEILDSRYSGLAFAFDSKAPVVAPVRVTERYWFRKNVVSTKWAVVQPTIVFGPYDFDHVWQVISVFDTQSEADAFRIEMNKGKQK